MTIGNDNGHAADLRFPCVERNNIRSTCTYLGSNPGTDPTSAKAVREWGDIIVANCIRLVCGGGGRGLMKELVEAVRRNGGYVTAITPKDLYETEGRASLPDIIDVSDLSDFRHVLEVVRARLVVIRGSVQIIVGSMGIRKLLMYELSDTFVAFPGGVGTLEEIVEQLTWKQLGHHKKPIGIYNHLGFWDPLLDLFHGMRRVEYITEKQPIDYAVAHTVRQILPAMCGEIESCGRVFKRPFNAELFGATAESVAVAAE